MEEKQNQYSFIKGLFSGILLCVAAVLVCGCGAAYVLWHRSSDNLEEKQRVEQKCQELQTYIDEYFLFDYDDENVENGIYRGMLSGLDDDYTAYFSKDEYKDFMQSTNGSYCGIGAVLSQNYETGLISVVEVFEGSPAEEAGIQAEDVLYLVDGEEIDGMDLSLIVADIKGEEGTEVKVGIRRGTEELEFTVTRRKVEIRTVASEMVDEEIGYIVISEFDDVTDKQFLAALEDLKEQGMKNLIIDLRNNGGGLLNVCCNMLDELLPEGIITYTEGKDGTRQDEYKSDAEHYFDGKMALLVNGYSASASEVFAGAIKDYGVGTLIGTQTFGKGIVQRVFTLKDGSAVKMTVSRYYTPAGNYIHGVGITPDIIVEAEADSEEDYQLMKAIEVLSE